MVIRGLLATLAAGAFFIDVDELRAQVRDTTRSDSTVFRLKGISVQAAQPVTTVGGTSAIEVRVDSLSLPPAPRLGEILRELPMIHVRTNSRGESELTLRGSESRQVAVLLDGVPLTLQWDARTDVSVIPATAIRELTFTRGLSSMLYGPNVLGGVVEVSVGHGSDRPTHPSMQIGAGFDHVGGYGTSGALTLPIATNTGQWTLRGGIGYRDAPGVPLADGVSEPLPADNENLRLNTDSNHRDGFFAVRYDADAGAWYSLSGSGFRAERGIAAELGNPEPRFWRYPDIARFVSVLSGGTGEKTTPLGAGDIEASIGVDVGSTAIDSYTDRDYRTIDGFENGEDRTLTARVLADHTMGERADLRAAFTFADIFHREILPSATNEYQQRFYSLGGETIIRLVERSGATLSLGAGGALDMGSTPKSADKPPLEQISDWGARVGLTATVHGGDLLLHAGVSRRGRFPALRELYSAALNRFEPNPSLTPEHLTAFETGFTTSAGGASVQAVFFHHRLDDAIVRITQPDRRFKRINRDQMRSTGIEFLASRAFGALSISGDLTLQSVDLMDPDAGSSSEPENQPAVFGSIHARFPVVLGARAMTEVRYTGSQFCLDLDTGDDRHLDGGSFINADVSRTWSIGASNGGWLSRLEARAGVDNIADTAIYDQCGLPQPGRLLRFEVRFF
jgi:iron complex outermembrane recepter protein